MKKNLIRISLVCCLLFTSLLFGNIVHAQDEEFPEPGIAPESPFYFLDTLGKKFNILFTFKAEAKVEKALQYAEERLAEAEIMAERNHVREMVRAANDYDTFMSMVSKRLEKAERYGLSDSISETVALSTGKHLAVLDKVVDRAPEDARETVLRARIASMNTQECALWALARNKPVRVIDITAEAIEGRLERARIRIMESDTTDASEALDCARRLIEIEDEMILIAEANNVDITHIQEQLAQSTANRLSVLAGVYDKVPEPVQIPIVNAIENSIGKYERAVDKLRQENIPVIVLDTEIVIENIKPAIRERLALSVSNQSQESSLSVSSEIQLADNNEQLSRSDTIMKPVTVSANQTTQLRATEEVSRNR